MVTDYHVIEKVHLSPVGFPGALCDVIPLAIAKSPALFSDHEPDDDDNDDLF